MKARRSQHRIAAVVLSVGILHLLIAAWLLHSKMPRGTAGSIEPVWASMEVVEASASAAVPQVIPESPALPEPAPAQPAITTETAAALKPDAVSSPQPPIPEAMPAKAAQPPAVASHWSGPIAAAPIAEPEGPPVAFVPAVTAATVPQNAPCPGGQSATNDQVQTSNCPRSMRPTLD